jgi:glycosyltransferase involved in cell wall biosynthesis
MDAEVNLPGMDEVGRTPRSAKENQLISVSFWDRGRYVERYLEVAERLPDYRLLLAGNWRLPDYRDEILRALGSKGLEDRVTLREGIPEPELVGLYQRSKFLLRFGFGEYGLATAVIEAMQNTLPVIINEDLGISDVIREHGAGAVLRDADPGAAARAVEELDDERAYAELQDNIAKLRSTHTWENHVRKLLAPVEPAL